MMGKCASDVAWECEAVHSDNYGQIQGKPCTKTHKGESRDLSYMCK